MTNLVYELSKLRHSGVVTLFVLDATALGAPTIYRLANQVNELGNAIVWQGNTYQPYPMEADGFEKRSDGPFPRPTVRAANVYGTLSALIRDFNRLKGARLTRKRTLVQYLDAVNFAAGNPLADPASEYPDEIWTIDRTSSRNKLQIEWELANPLDVAGVMLPGRQVRPSYCPWVYRGGDCGYTGGAVAKLDDTPTTVLAEDRCGKRLVSCQKRHPGELPFGGFPGVGVIRQV